MGSHRCKLCFEKFRCFSSNINRFEIKALCGMLSWLSGLYPPFATVIRCGCCSSGQGSASCVAFYREEIDDRQRYHFFRPYACDTEQADGAEGRARFVQRLLYSSIASCASAAHKLKPCPPLRDIESPRASSSKSKSFEEPRRSVSPCDKIRLVRWQRIDYGCTLSQ